MAKQKKHQPEAEEAAPRPFRFMNSVQWQWDGHQWIIPELGDWWLGHLLNRGYKFNFDHYDEYGLISCWSLVDHAEGMIRKYSKLPIFSIDPTPMFLQRWLDTWIEFMYCRLWCHVFDTLRLSKGVAEHDAAYRADVLASEFEALFEPTFPRVPKPQKRRGKNDRSKTQE